MKQLLFIKGRLAQTLENFCESLSLSISIGHIVKLHDHKCFPTFLQSNRTTQCYKYTNTLFHFLFLTSGVNPSSAPHLTLTTDNYETYHPREDQNRIIVNNLERPDYGSTRRHIHTWSEPKPLTRSSGDFARKSFSHASITPRKERGTASRPQSVSRTKVPKYTEVGVNDRNIDSVTTAGLPTTSIIEKTDDIRNNIESSIILVGPTATYAYLDDNAYTL